MQSDDLHSELYELTDELLKSNKMVKIKVSGDSMLPLLRSGDVVTIKQCSADELRIGDIIGFKSGDKWVAHRLLKKLRKEDKTYLLCKGDASRNYDDAFTKEKLVGKIISFNRKGKEKDLESTYYNNLGYFIAHNSWLLTPVILFILAIGKSYGRVNHNTKSIWKNLKFVSRKSRKLSYFNIIIALFQGLLPFVIIYLIKWLVNDITHIGQQTDKTEAFRNLVLIITATGLVFLANSILSIVSAESRERLSQSISHYIYDLLHKKHTSLDMAYLENAEQQNKIHRAVQEAGFRPLKMVTESLSIVTSVMSVGFIILLLLTIHWSIFLLFLIAVLPGFIVRLRFAESFYQLNKANSSKEREAYYYNRILTGLPFAKELRLFSLGEFFSSRFTKVQTYLHQRKNTLLRKRMIADIIAQIFAVAVIFISFGIVSYMAVKESISIGSVVLFFLVFQQGFSVMKNLFNSVAGLSEDNVFLRDFFDFLELPSTRKAVETIKNTTPLRSGMVIENISFHYPSSQRKALDSVSIEIPAGKTIAIVGANGSGKTTLVKLLCSFYQPDSGRILMDDMDIAEIDPDEFRKQITAVFQDFALYNMTAAENIYLGNISEVLNADDIKKAAQNAGIADILESLPFGYDNMLGNLFEKGEELSIGQWQKIAIARAFYRNSPLLFMDEPSSALDAETELQLLQNLKLLAKDKTVLIISHRLSTIKWADMIYVMEEGKVIERGKHEQLIDLKGKYYTMFGLNRVL